MPSLLLEAVEAIIVIEVMDSRAWAAEEEQEEGAEEGEDEKAACGGTGGSGPFLLVDVNVVIQSHEQAVEKSSRSKH